MDRRQERAERRRLLLENLHLEEQGIPGASEMVRKIADQIEDPPGAAIEVIYPSGETHLYYGQAAVKKRCRIGSATLVKHLFNEQPDQKGRRYRYV